MNLLPKLKSHLLKWLPAYLLALFVIIRLPGLDVPYYQDEWKNVVSSATAADAGKFFAHPPLMQILFVADYALFGMDGFRMLPLIITAAALWLLYIAVRNRAGRTAGLWAMGLGVFCFYNILGALQTDVDGSVLPFCFLLALIAYDKVCALTAGAAIGRVPGSRAKLWMLVFVGALLVGMLTKLSFALAVGVFICDFLWNNRRNRLAAHIGLGAAFGIVLIAIWIGMMYLIQAVYPAFSVSFMLSHAQQFTSTAGRNWTQIIVQGVKALYYLSPLLIAPLVFVSRDILRRMRPFLIYLIVGGLFYFALFDFSQGALDKYLMFATVPLLAIAGTCLGDVWPRIRASMNGRRGVWIATGISILMAGLIFYLNFLNPAVVALYPKSEWFGRVLHGNWNILTPITGGSGPMGFYVSFLFIAISCIGAILLAVVARLALKGKFGDAGRFWAVPAMCAMLAVGLVYNSVFAQEYMYGGINGSSAKVLAADLEFIRQSPLVRKVMTYNDTGAGPLSLMDAYAGRIYATPGAEDQYRAKFAAFDGHYLVVDVPRLYPDGFYAKFFSTCTILYHSVSKQISGTVYKCPKP